jgi:hypothetical protein
MKAITWISVLAATIAGCGVATAQSADEIRKYARDGRALTRAELTIYLLHRASPVLAQYDKNLNGRIDPQEAAKISRDAEKALGKGYVAAQRDEALDTLGPRPTIPIDELAQLSPATKADSDASDQPQRLFVRRNRIDLGIAGFGANPIPTSDAEGARVAYSFDGLTKTNTWDIDGVASYVIASGDWPDQKYRSGVPTLTAYAFIPWLGVNRHTSSDPNAARTDKYSTGVDSAFEIYGGPFGGVSYLTLGPSFQTDRSSQASIFDFAAHWQPFGILGIGTWRTVVPSVQVTWHAGLDATYRQVNNPGLFVLPGSEFAWTGGWVQGKLRYRYNSDYVFTLSATYNRYYDWLNKRDAGLFSADLAYQIDPQGMTSISFTYKRGRDWTTYARFDLLTAGLNFKL